MKDDIGGQMNWNYDRENKHVDDWNNHTFKGCIRSIFHSLTFIIIPNFIVKKLTIIATRRLDWC